jgi:hypothetical protein
VSSREPAYMPDLYSLNNRRHSFHQLYVVFCKHSSFKADIIRRSYIISVPILRAICVSMGHTKYAGLSIYAQESTDSITSDHATAHLRHVSQV